MVLEELEAVTLELFKSVLQLGPHRGSFPGPGVHIGDVLELVGELDYAGALGHNHDGETMCLVLIFDF